MKINADNCFRSVNGKHYLSQISEQIALWVRAVYAVQTLQQMPQQEGEGFSAFHGGVGII